jgi:hypothetical protein
MNSFFEIINKNEINILDSNKILTENGCPTYLSANTPLIELNMVLRQTSDEVLYQRLHKAFDINGLSSMKILANLRDREKGKGERELTRKSLQWIISQNTDFSQKLLPNLKYFVNEFGRWDDIYEGICQYIVEKYNSLNLPSYQPVFNHCIKLMGEQLLQDIANNNPSICAKWIGRHYPVVDICIAWYMGLIYFEEVEFKSTDEVMKFFIDIVGIPLKYPKSKNHNRHFNVKNYIYQKKIDAGLMRLRKNYLSPINKKLNTVEVKLCAKQPIDNFSSLPSGAQMKYKTKFVRDELYRDKYLCWLNNVMLGKAKVNGKTLMPHEIIKNIMDFSNMKKKNMDFDPKAILYQAQWNVLVEHIKNQIQEKINKSGDDWPNTLVVVDVSGSMTGLPMQVSISLGLLLSDINKGYFHHKLITFSEHPTLVEVIGDKIIDQVDFVKNMNWGMNTDLKAVFNIILNAIKSGKVSDESLPKRVIIITDGQFDSMITGNKSSNTLWEEIISMFKLEFGDKFMKYLPECIFWNVNGQYNDFATNKNEEGIAMISGFSPNIVKYTIGDDLIEDNKDDNKDEKKKITPQEIVERILNDERYSGITW